MKKMLLNLWIILSLFLMMSCQIAVASISDDIDAIVDKVWAEIDQKEQGKQ